MTKIFMLLVSLLLVAESGCNTKVEQVGSSTLTLQKKVYLSSFGILPNSQKDQTALIQYAFKSAAADSAILVIDKGVYYINGTEETDNKQYLYDKGGIKVYSNSTIIFEKGATFNVLPNDFEAYNALRVWNASNVRISGGNLVGERKNHKGTKGEWGYGIFIAGSENVVISDMKISEFWGDGINLNCSNINNNLKINYNVTISNVHSYNNRRQGMSIEAGKKIRVSNSVFQNNRGTNPQSGIDIEPWSDLYDHVEDVLIEKCIFTDNPNGIMINFPTLKNIVVKDCHFKATKKGLVERHIWQLYGDNELTVDDCEFDSTATNILINSGKSTTIKNCTFNNDVVLDALTALNVTVSNSNFNKAFLTVRNSTSGELTVFKSSFVNDSSIELRGTISTAMQNNTFKNSNEIFISDQSSAQVTIAGNKFNNSKFQAISTDGDAIIKNNETTESEVFIVVKENAQNLLIERNFIDTKIKQSLSFVKVNSNINIGITNNKVLNKTSMLKNYQYDLLKNNSNYFIDNNTFKVLSIQQLPKTYKRETKVEILN